MPVEGPVSRNSGLICLPVEGRRATVLEENSGPICFQLETKGPVCSSEAIAFSCLFPEKRLLSKGYRLGSNFGGIDSII